MGYLTNREFAEQLFRQKKRNEYTDALMEEVRRLREENEMLQAQLTAEKRKIVRCNECKHVDYSGCRDKTVYCLKNECYMQEDCYCSYGERENGGVK